MQSLESAISDTGKTVLPKHLLLAASCLSASGEFVGLNSKGLARQRQHASVSSPFVQACFSVSFHIFYYGQMLLYEDYAQLYNPYSYFGILLQNPGSHFIKAAKAGVTDDLQGSLDALAWGNCPSMGTGGQFDIIYSNEVKLIDSSSIICQAGN